MHLRVPRRRADLVSSRSAARKGRRAAGTTRWRRSGQARQRELCPEPVPHCFHSGCTDDRPRARHSRGHAGDEHAQFGQGRHRIAARHRLRGHVEERLRRLPGSGRGADRVGTRRRRGDERQAGEGEGCRRDDHGARGRRHSRPDGEVPVDGRQRRVAGRSRCGWRDPQAAVRREAPPGGRQQRVAPHSSRRAPLVHRPRSLPAGRVRPHGPALRRRRHVEGRVRLRVPQAPEHPRARRARAGCNTGHAGGRPRRPGRVPGHESCETKRST